MANKSINIKPFIGIYKRKFKNPLELKGSIGKPFPSTGQRLPRR